MFRATQSVFILGLITVVMSAYVYILESNIDLDKKANC